MLDSTATWTVGQKSAQMGYTTAAMMRTFFKIDIQQKNILYLLPSKTPDATDFSVTRFDPLLELSPHLKNLFSSVKNVGVKRAGSATLYIRGSNSTSGLKSIPVSSIVFDEYDEMNQENMELAIERTSGQIEKDFWAISTPTVPNHGINALFLESTQEHFFFKCPGCSKFIQLVWPESFVLCGEHLLDPDIKKSYLQCTECKRELLHEEKTEAFSNHKWIPQGHNDRDFRGFYINQLYSPVIKPWEITRAYLKGQLKDSAEQEFYKSKIGIPFVPKGGRVNDVLLKDATKTYRKTDSPTKHQIVTMGVDVGKWLHYEIAHWFVDKLGNDINMISRCKVIQEGKVTKFSELHKLMREYSILMCVIDAQPETRMAYEFACIFWNHVKMCTYGHHLNQKSMVISSQDDSHRIAVDRTTWLDTSLGRFHNKTIDIPADTSEEYRQHIKNLVKTYRKNKQGNNIAEYVTVGGDDHFGHARNYNEMALPLAATIISNSNIERFL